MPRPAFPTGLRQFQQQFADEAACRAYLEACRWPDGFRCPRCQGRRAYPLREWHRRECAQCRYQVSLTAGTVFHRTKTPLTHLQVYLDEFVFRHNRRKTLMAAFQTLLGLGTVRGPTPGRLVRRARDLPQFSTRS